MTKRTRWESLLRVMGWAGWVAFLGVIGIVLFVDFLRAIAPRALAVCGVLVGCTVVLSLHVMLLHVIFSRELSRQEKVKWILLLFVGGPIVSNTYLVSEDRHISWPARGREG